ncbi:MAG: lysylphosphatidylglycerol synthase domain-containing protein [Gaiella sp.]
MSPPQQLTGFAEAAYDQVAALDGRYLLPALVLQVLTLVLKAGAWRNVIVAAYPGTRVSWLGVGCSYVAGVALNAFLPARGGDAAKIGFLRAQLPGAKVTTLAGTMGALSLVDGLLGAMLALGLWSAGLAPGLPGSWSSQNGAFIAGGLVTLAAGVLGLRRVLPQRLRRFLQRVGQGFAALRSPALYARGVLPFQLAAWSCRIAVVWCVLAAFHIEAGVATAALLVVLGGVSAAVPVPGGGGAQQVLATYALYGVVSAASALSFSIGLQVGITAVNTAVGLIGAMILVRTVRPLAAVRALRASRR